MYIVLDLFHILGCYLYRIYGMQINSIQFNSLISPKQLTKCGTPDSSTNYESLSLTIIFQFLKSYLQARHFHVKVAQQYTELFPVKAGVPQSSVLGSLLYLLYTADLPTSPNTTTATFVDDNAVLATDSDPAIASHKLQTGLLAIKKWLKTWRHVRRSTISCNYSNAVDKSFCAVIT
jgi:hypothetical protein